MKRISVSLSDEDYGFLLESAEVNMRPLAVELVYWFKRAFKEPAVSVVSSWTDQEYPLPYTTTSSSGSEKYSYDMSGEKLDGEYGVRGSLYKKSSLKKK